MSGIITATTVAGVSGLGAGAAGLSTAEALGVAGLGFTVASGLYSSLAKPAQASGATEEAQVNQSETTAASARTNLLETAGGSAGEVLAPSQVGGNKNTIFGN